MDNAGLYSAKQERKLTLIELLRFFIPSWRFFDRLGAVPILYYRTDKMHAESEQWSHALAKPERSLSQLFFNPKGTEYLMHLSLVDRLVHEANADSVEGLISFDLVKNLVAYRIAQLQEPAKQFQFKVAILNEKNAEAEDFLESGWFDV